MVSLDISNFKQSKNNFVLNILATYKIISYCSFFILKLLLLFCQQQVVDVKIQKDCDNLSISYYITIAAK